MECPSCGREILLEDIRPDGFQCPWCKEHLQRAFRGGRLAFTVILLLAWYLCYAAGVRGVDVFLLGLVVSFFLGLVYHFFTAIYWPKLKKDLLTRDEFPHIVAPSTTIEKVKENRTGHGG